MTVEPPKRLRDYKIGDTVQLTNVWLSPDKLRQLKITAINDDGYYELSPGVTAAGCHEVSK